METPNAELNKTIDYVFLKNEDGFDKVFRKDILYGEAKGSYTSIYTKQKEYLISRNLSHLLQCLEPFPEFVRVHRSYFVNISEVEKYFKDYLTIGSFEIPVSRAYRNELGKNFLFI